MARDSHKTQGMKLKIAVFLSVLCLSGIAVAQRGERGRPGGERMGGSITGYLMDAGEKTPLQYANVVLYRSTDSVQVAGSASNSEGVFEILKVRPGRYYLRVFYIGYEIKEVGNISLQPPAMKVDLGTIVIARGALMADEVEVTAGRLPLTYQVDKKVVNVSEFQTAVSGNAVDILEKVPSVRVDVDGNVSLRGTTNFTVLIDGRPSVLDPSEALQQIPAGTIENIEIITNPSARYNPAGTSGIINIQLKKNRQTGRSGMINLNVGATDRYGGDVILEQKSTMYSVNVAVDYNRQFIDGKEEELFRTTQNNTTSTLTSDGDSRRGRTSFGLRGGLDFFPRKSDLFSLGGRIGFGDFGRTGKLNYFATSENQNASYISANDRGREMRFYAFNVGYQHLFDPKNHQINTDVFFSRRSGDEHTEDALTGTSGIQSEGRKSTEDGPSHDVRLKVDYLLGPESSRFEAGYQYEVDFSTDHNATLEYDSLASVYIANPLYRHVTEYNSGIHAVYVLYSGKAGPLNYQGGLRSEYTDRVIEFDSLTAVTRKRWDFYPTLHSSFEITPTLQGMASYTRRTERPRAWYLEPFETWIDAYNVRTGNPALKQEFIDSYEGGLRKNFGKVMVSSEMYYRITYNKVERVRSVYSENVTLQSVENVGRDYALGNEGLITAEISKWISTNITANAYRYKIKGNLFGESFSRSSFNWNLRMNTTFRPTARLMIQVDGQYESASSEAQGREKASYLINAAVRYDIIPKQFSATLQIRDVFATYKHEDISEGPEFYNRHYGTREAPVVMLNLRYVFNNYKPDRQRGRNSGGAEDEDF